MMEYKNPCNIWWSTAVFGWKPTENDNMDESDVLCMHVARHFGCLIVILWINNMYVICIALPKNGYGCRPFSQTKCAREEPFSAHSPYIVIYIHVACRIQYIQYIYLVGTRIYLWLIHEIVHITHISFWLCVIVMLSLAACLSNDRFRWCVLCPHSIHGMSIASLSLCQILIKIIIIMIMDSPFLYLERTAAEQKRIYLYIHSICIKRFSPEEATDGYKLNIMVYAMLCLRCCPSLYGPIRISVHTACPFAIFVKYPEKPTIWAMTKTARSIAWPMALNITENEIIQRRKKKKINQQRMRAWLPIVNSRTIYAYFCKRPLSTWLNTAERKMRQWSAFRRYYVYLWILPL